MSTYNNYNEERPSSNSTALTIFAIVVVALIAIGMFMWQPWNAPAPNSAPTIINTPAQSQPDTTIINPPSNIIVPPVENSGSGTEGGNTEININSGSGEGGAAGEGGTTGEQSSEPPTETTGN